MTLETIQAGLLGLAVGDALGVPVEFRPRAALDAAPVTGMRAYGTHSQPAGTWSDDTSMALCVLETLAERGMDWNNMMARFHRWADEGYLTPYGRVFDIGCATRSALARYWEDGLPPLECGGTSARDNGNGSLMRILPMALYLHRRQGPAFPSMPASYEAIRLASSLTHAHPVSVMACGIFCAAANELLCGRFTPEDLQHGIAAAKGFYAIQPAFAPWLEQFERVDGNILPSLPREAIQSGGYVLHTLEAALWCLLRTDSFSACVLEAVNLGEDTDTTAAVAGGLAGIRYGLEAIPPEWLAVLARREDIEGLCKAFWDSDQ